MSVVGGAAESASVRLARYLKEFVALRTTTVRDVAKYESVVWFGDMPRDPDCHSGAWADGYEADRPWLEVHKQQFEGPPESPALTADWVDRKALQKATPEIPPLRTSILVEDTEAELAEGESPPLIEIHLSDHPEVTAAYESYRPKWVIWAAEHRRRESIQKVYSELFRLHTQVQKQGEILEVVLGLGLVDWRAKIGDRTVPIRRHAVVAQVEIVFDPRKGVIRVSAPGDGGRLRIEDDMLEAELRPDRTYHKSVEAQLDELGDAIWDRAAMHAALKTWGGALSADSEWFDGLGAKPAKGNDPVISFAPALILRKRLQVGMVRIYERLIENLRAGDAEIPDGWGRLIDDGWGGGGGHGASARDPGRERQDRAPQDNEIYFPLPANREQRRIVEALDRDQGVLVQGPPGTGKSHTIANLMCHLLATGKRVLITAETGRALQVLKDKLPAEIQPLCVSLLGQGGDAFAELNSAVQGITSRQSSFSKAESDDRIAETDRDLDRARRDLTEIDSEIRGLRQDETATHSLFDGTYHGTASKIAARVAEERDRFCWLSDAARAEGQPPISNAVATRWLEIRRMFSNEDAESVALRIPESASLPTPADFARFVENESVARAESERIESHRSHPAFGAIHALPADWRSELREALKAIEERRLGLVRVHAEWLQPALQEIIVGRDARWKTLLDISRQRLEAAEQLLERIGSRVTKRPDGVDPRKLRADSGIAIEHLRAGGKWKRLGVVTPKVLKDRTYLRKAVLVDGLPADDVEKLGIVCDELDLKFALSDVVAAWKDVGLSKIPADRRLCIASLKGQASLLDRALEYAVDCDLAARLMSREQPPVPVPGWLDGAAENWIEVIDAVELDRKFGDASRQVEACGEALRGLSKLHDVHPVVEAISRAVAVRDGRGYSEAYDRVISIEQTRELLAARDRIASAIHGAAPGALRHIEETIDDPAWDTRLAEWEEAWRWAVANDWLEKRSDFDYQQKLWRRRHEAEAKVGRLLARLVSLRAWDHFFDRLTPKEANALRSWREAVRAMGKGTGKSAKLARLRQDARRYMDACRDAIPIWIMPRYLVAEMIDPTPGRYDLVIVDEASQLGIESLFLFYVSKQIIVVGDDQQISPAGVGVADAAVAGLQQHHLDGVPHQHALSPQSSLYGNAKIRFNQNIVLREHFRCMPEIIQFSNDLCYANNGTPLDPLRAYPANRLDPLVVRHVPDGYRKGTTQYAQNPPEAEAIVEQICACIEDPRYAGATIGVISLQGEAQAKLIENLLLKTLDPEVIEERRLICGDAYAFQGDERTVIFLSMVAAPGEHRIGALSNEAARQRFNVAVSRAQDQLWLFHTAQLGTLSDACMRHRLLSYMLDPRRQTTDEEEQRFDSEFERHVYRRLTDRGYQVRTQVCVGDPANHRYRIDLVVEGMQGRLAVECDGDEWHGIGRYEQDMARQRDLERAGWQFVRIRGGDFYRDAAKAMEPVWAELDRLGIQPGGVDPSAAAPPEPRMIDLDSDLGDELMEPTASEPPPPEPDEHTDVPAEPVVESGAPSFPGPGPRSTETAPGSQTQAEPEPTSSPEAVAAPSPEADELPLFTEPRSSAVVPEGAAPYVAFEGPTGPDPRNGSADQVAEGLHRIITVEGPMLAKRAYDVYLRGCGVHRMGGELKKSMNRALQHAIRSGQVVKEDESGSGGLVSSIVRSAATPPVVLRERGPRDFEEIPPSELQLVGRRLSRDGGLEAGSDAHLRIVLERFELKRLTVQVQTRLLDVLVRRYPYVDEILRSEETR